VSDREKLIHAAITELAAGMTTVGLYGGDHPRAGIIVDRLAELLQTLLAQESELTFVLLGEELFVQGTPMTRACRQAPSVIRRMRRRMNQRRRRTRQTARRAGRRRAAG
jgi:hypothetical protein